MGGTVASADSRRLTESVALLVGPRTIFWLAVAVVASLVLAVVELSISVFLQLFLKGIGLLDASLQTPLRWLHPTPSQLAAGLCLIALARSISQFFVGQSSTVAMETINARLRRIAIWDMLLHPTMRIVPAAAVNARVGDLAVKSSLFCYAGASLVASSVQAIALVGVMCLTAFGETVIAVVGLAIVGAVILRVNSFTRAATSNVPTELRTLTEGIERVARNMALVRVLRTQRLEHFRLATAIDKYAKYLVNAGYFGNFAAAVTPFAGILLILVIVGSSRRFLYTPPIALLSFLYLFVRFVQALTLATSQFSNCSSTWTSFRDSLDYVAGFAAPEVEAAMRVDSATANRSDEASNSPPASPPSIRVNGVSFAYPGATTAVLREFSIDVGAGTQLAVVGQSGRGKSTLLALVLGLLEPTAGEIRVGGRAPKEFFGDAGIRVGYVGAEAFLIAGSIRDNLRYGFLGHANDEALFEALASAHLRDVVECLPGGLEYLIGEDGSGLSAGQKQRLCLARALLNRPQVLILDEASANLDAETESDIAESLNALRGACTIVIVSHRTGLLKYADRTVALGDVETQNDQPVGNST